MGGLVDLGKMLIFLEKLLGGRAHRLGLVFFIGRGQFSLSVEVDVDLASEELGYLFFSYSMWGQMRGADGRSGLSILKLPMS